MDFTQLNTTKNKKSNKNSANSIKQAFVNLFGVLGYLACLLQWLGVTILYLPLFFESKVHDMLIRRDTTQAPTTQSIGESTVGSPGQAWIFIGLVITVLVAILSVVILIKLPTSVARTGQALTSHTADKVVSSIKKRQTITSKKQKRLKQQTVLLLKLSFILVPVALSIGSYFINLPLSYYIIVIIACIGAAAAIILFAIQLILASKLGVKRSQLL